MLSESEITLYRSIYCGLCHSLGKIAGQFARFGLSYDFVFLALMRMAVLKQKPLESVIHCPAHPFKGCRAVTDSPTLDYCAALFVLLQYETIQDKKLDEKGFRRIAPYAIEVPTKTFLTRASKSIELPEQTVKQLLKELRELENENCPSPNAPAEIFAELLAEVSAFGIEDEMMHFAIYKIMFHLGKWIYLIDAADDYRDDIKNGRFNPFQKEAPDPDRLKNALDWELLCCEDILAKIPDMDPSIRHIIRNILFNGTTAVTDSVLYPKKNRKESKKQHE